MAQYRTALRNGGPGAVEGLLVAPANWLPDAEAAGYLTLAEYAFGPGIHGLLPCGG